MEQGENERNGFWSKSFRSTIIFSFGPTDKNVWRERSGSYIHPHSMSGGKAELIVVSDGEEEEEARVKPLSVPEASARSRNCGARK
jgi:hypothetical protein